jgi:hypothetical protein
MIQDLGLKILISDGHWHGLHPPLVWLLCLILVYTPTGYMSTLDNQLHITRGFTSADQHSASIAISYMHS